MKTFSKIVKARKKQLVEGLSEQEAKWILQSLVNIALEYRISGNHGMFNHIIGNS